MSHGSTVHPQVCYTDTNTGRPVILPPYDKQEKCNKVQWLYCSSHNEMKPWVLMVILAAQRGARKAASLWLCPFKMHLYRWCNSTIMDKKLSRLIYQFHHCNAIPRFGGSVVDKIFVEISTCVTNMSRSKVWQSATVCLSVKQTEARRPPLLDHLNSTILRTKHHPHSNVD